MVAASVRQMRRESCSKFQKVSDSEPSGHPIPCSGMHRQLPEEYSPSMTVYMDPLPDMDSSETFCAESSSLQDACQRMERPSGYSQVHKKACCMMFLLSYQVLVAGGSENDIRSNRLFVHLRSQNQGISHQVVHNAGAALGMAVDGTKSCVLDNAGGAAGP